MTEPEPPSAQPDTSTVATLQSLIVAFVLAMTFRGFVTEGFVIPTGSMAPTLMGEHLLLHSDQTGSTYPVDAKGYKRASAVYDPMLGSGYPLNAAHVRSQQRTRMGDRILVLKSLYPFAEPDRFDVVVFKNPTDPDGDAENYIKRLIGLPNEAVWLVDGDVFAGPAEEPDDHAAYEIQRKPEHIQRAVWQPVHDSDFMPVNRERLAPRYAVPWSGEHWLTRDRRDYRCDTAETTTLAWDPAQIQLTDWTSYNMFALIRTGRAFEDRNISDLRVCADIVADQPGLSVTLELEAREHVFQFTIAEGRAVTRFRPVAKPGGWIAEQSAEVAAPAPGRVYSVEFWHADQGPDGLRQRPARRAPAGVRLAAAAADRALVQRDLRELDADVARHSTNGADAAVDVRRLTTGTAPGARGPGSLLSCGHPHRAGREELHAARPGGDRPPSDAGVRHAP
ncbi:MAG: S26 family signal peptidase [Planctomycetota bacterium]|jgi:signal peptidase I